MSSQTLKRGYPHRLKFLDHGNCDVCHRIGQKSVSVPNTRYFGLVSCGKDLCNKTVSEWIQDTTKSLENLESFYGDRITVRRQNGSIEYDWKIVSDAFQESADDDFWVYVRKGHQTKLVRLSDLDNWR